MEVEQAARASEAMNFPTSGKFAAWLWESFSGNSTCTLPFDEAGDAYRKCGYIAFSGYPLKRSGKIPTMTREQVEDELKSNPYCRMEEEDAPDIKVSA